MTIYVGSQIVPSELNCVPQEYLVYDICSGVMGDSGLNMCMWPETFYLYGNTEMGVQQEDMQGAGCVILEAS